MTQAQLELTIPAAVQVKRKGRPREFDRELALEAALNIFRQMGYEPATLPQLCEAMDINPPSLYAAFGNKSALYMEALRYYQKKFWTAPFENLLTEPDIQKAINNFFMEAAIILLAPGAPGGDMLVLGAVNICACETDIISLVSQLRGDINKKFVERLAKAIEDGQIPADTDIFTLARALRAFLEGMSLQARNGLFLFQLKAIAGHAVSLLPIQTAAG